MTLENKTRMGRSGDFVSGMSMDVYTRAAAIPREVYPRVEPTRSGGIQTRKSTALCQENMVVIETLL